MIQSKQIQRPQRVLIVDDQEINREILGVILEDDYELLYACDGREAMELIRAHAEDLSLVMLDLMMPIMDGFAVLEAMHADEQTKGIPVIVLTAEKNAELRALQLGAADFITKPFDLHEVILARIGRIIELSEGRQLISAAERDKLSTLYTRNFFFEYAERLHTYHPELHMDAIELNIEQFHTVNALNGRDFGNRVLRQLGEEIRAFLAETEGIAGRIEADRFNIFCLCPGDYRELLKRFQDKLDSFSPHVSIRLRMGVKPWSEGVEPVTQFDGARAACNMVRGNYQRALMVYDDSMRARELLNRRLLNDLRRSVEEKQLTVFYQPKYNVQVDPPRLSSAEALIRWKHPELGMISPGVFVPLFEGNGMISIIDNYVWREAARQCAEWKKRYGRTFPISVNLSRADIIDLSLIDTLKGLILDNGLDFRDLKLEVTESAYTDNANLILQLISSLRELGFEIEMDDFGSGYSSLNMLSSMPIDVLKIDMKFVQNIAHSETDRRLVKLIIDIARFLRIRVVAEGVETAEQLELLKSDGCDLNQGYYFSRPLPPEDFEKLIEREIAIERE